jgi:hypothetical protein
MVGAISTAVEIAHQSLVFLSFLLTRQVCGFAVTLDDG